MSAALISKLLAAGTPHELVAEVAMELAHAQAAGNLLEERRAKDRERKRVPRISGESGETAEIQEKGSAKVSPGNPLPNNSQNSAPPKGPPHRFSAPAGVSESQWAAFRKQRKKSLSEHSYTLICNKLTKLDDAGWPPGDMIDLAIERGWETVFEPRDQRNGSQSQSSLRGPRPDPTLELVRAAAAAQRQGGGDHGEARLALPARKLG